MKEQMIIGAGLSGLVAAVNLAEKGYRVVVRERRESPGGPTEVEGLEGKVINIGDGTPIELHRLSAYIGIDISQAAVPLDGCRNHIYGRTFDIEFYEKTPSYLVERGPRPTSLDTFLYETARSRGVEFHFNDTVLDFGDLPADTIIATGLFGEAFSGLDLPHLPVYGYLAMKEIEDDSPRVVIYFDEYTRDYAFYSQVNGACGAVLFSRGKPLDASVKDRFKRQLATNDGIEFEDWTAVSIGALPVARVTNPRLFARNYILAGTLSGTIDPLLLFGVHGALVSGKIAAMAVEDHMGGLKEFYRVNRFYPVGYLASMLYRTTPMWLLKRVAWSGARLYPRIAPLLGKKMFRLLPGYGRLP